SSVHLKKCLVRCLLRNAHTCAGKAAEISASDLPGAQYGDNNAHALKSALEKQFPTRKRRSFNTPSSFSKAASRRSSDCLDDSACMFISFIIAVRTLGKTSANRGRLYQGAPSSRNRRARSRSGSVW